MNIERVHEESAIATDVLWEVKIYRFQMRGGGYRLKYGCLGIIIIYWGVGHIDQNHS